MNETLKKDIKKQDQSETHFLFIPRNLTVKFDMNALLLLDFEIPEQFEEIKSRLEQLNVLINYSQSNNLDDITELPREFFVLLQILIDYPETIKFFNPKSTFSFAIQIINTLVTSFLKKHAYLLENFAEFDIITKLVTKVPKISVTDLLTAIFAINPQYLIKISPECGPYLLEAQQQCLYNDEWASSIINVYSFFFRVEAIPAEDLPNILTFVFNKAIKGLSCAFKLLSYLQNEEYVQYLVQNGIVFKLIRMFTLFDPRMDSGVQSYIFDVLFNVCASPFFGYLLEEQIIDDEKNNTIIYYLCSWNRSYHKRINGLEIFDKSCKILCQLLETEGFDWDILLRSELAQYLPVFMSEVTTPEFITNTFHLIYILFNNDASTQYSQQFDISNLFETIYSSTNLEIIKNLLRFVIAVNDRHANNTVTDEFWELMQNLTHDELFLSSLDEFIDNSDDELKGLTYQVNNIINDEE
ncbi:hypothetical protein TVAG_265990 [Trichomonas vaginalis G3]|uniref:Uncharacterized protein n=1 Tax=Trichomonas vaginalis (strain ATCC PRA-98 / G3) TaxID=412133 RepID=A2F2J6_TRIV3|nr:armadillo (ARM) repeat-containing protein family [Trichomonas vaginalis G3]EAY00896.1 hypothetical protein TVAG_265990 [Trichomonas vaginalis G3]KAI5489231.1 armadillo (ARM) repeat-containing protein family [Trichomonas vaginalis G3]|eukprot:XP_001313825.1 hypothetical protein [Trichomonas vaginalis G3]